MIIFRHPCVKCKTIMGLSMGLRNVIKQHCVRHDNRTMQDPYAKLLKIQKRIKKLTKSIFSSKRTRNLGDLFLKKKRKSVFQKFLLF